MKIKDNRKIGFYFLSIPAFRRYLYLKLLCLLQAKIYKYFSSKEHNSTAQNHLYSSYLRFKKKKQPKPQVCRWVHSISRWVKIFKEHRGNWSSSQNLFLIFEELPSSGFYFLKQNSCLKKQENLPIFPKKFFLFLPLPNKKKLFVSLIFKWNFENLKS